jgi:hypothetical protein
LIEDIDSGHVAGEKVRCELDSFEGAAERTCDRFGEHRLADPGDILNEDVTPAKQGYEDEEHLVPLADDDPLDVIADQARDTLDCAGIHQLR